MTNCAESATMVYVDNVYFEQGYDSFGNQKRTSITISANQDVEVGKEGNNYNTRYPVDLYVENYYSSKSVSVIVYRNTVDVNNRVGTATITSTWNSLTISESTLTYSEGFNSDDNLIFTFNSKYYTYSNRYWSESRNEVSYTATCTVGDLLNGNVELYFDRQR